MERDIMGKASKEPALVKRTREPSGKQAHTNGFVDQGLDGWVRAVDGANAGGFHSMQITIGIDTRTSAFLAPSGESSAAAVRVRFPSFSVFVFSAVIETLRVCFTRFQ